MTAQEKMLLWGGGIVIAIIVLFRHRSLRERTCTADINDPASAKCNDAGPLQGALDVVDDVFDFFTLGGHASVTTEEQCETGACLGDQLNPRDDNEPPKGAPDGTRPTAAPR